MPQAVARRVIKFFLGPIWEALQIVLIVIGFMFVFVAAFILLILPAMLASDYSSWFYLLYIIELWLSGYIIKESV